MVDRLSDRQISGTFARALQTKDLLDKNDTSVIFYDLSFLDRRIRDLLETSPTNTLHAIAIKATPVRSILRQLCALGVGLEAASLPELHLALDTGFPPDRIVFDSPTKTSEELEYALNLGIHVNADSLPELERIEALLLHRQPKGAVGVRINPQIGTGAILSTSVAGDYSKFGVPLTEKGEELKAAFARYGWLHGVHLHIGSQGCSVEMLLAGVGRVLSFVHQVNAALRASRSDRQIGIIDLGGGLPVSYHRDKQAVSLSQYRDALNDRFPELFSEQFKLITEFGRYIYANAGWVAGRVEYVKSGKATHTAMIHVGADLFLRECYNPRDWHHEICVVDRTGRLKVGFDTDKYTVAGPLCFAGDVIARDVELPRIEAGDYVIIQDTGAYTLSMWSRYNSRQIPKVVGYFEDGVEFETLKARETIEDILRFWN